MNSNAPLTEPLALSDAHPSSRFLCGDFTVLYELDVESGKVEWSLVPNSISADMVTPRRFLETPEVLSLPKSFQPIRANRGLTSLVQLKLMEDNTGAGFAGGRTMRSNETVDHLRFAGQVYSSLNGQGFEVRTIMKGNRDYRCDHVLRYESGDDAVTVHTEFKNLGDTPLTLEMLSSFALGGISPFDTEDSVERLRFHRFRSSWSAEGRHEATDLEDLQMERSWLTVGVINERFGQVGSMPVRSWFPFAAVEDYRNGVFWAVQLACPGSWQMELFRWDDKVSLSGGLADREFGHWTKRILPNEEFSTPKAYVTTACGPFDGVCQRLVRMQEKALASQPDLESELPILFNEWCSSWGSPTPEFIHRTADRLRDTPVKIFVIDDGWAEKPDGVGQFNGDWNVALKRFPDGLRPVADDLKAHGLVPGLWFEFEVCTQGTHAFESQYQKLRRDGRTLQVGTRHFWDFSDPWTFEYLRKKVIERLGNDGFGYLKVDYNDTIGLGCEHPDSLGEGLRAHLEGVQNFFRELRRSLPNLIIEVCSSGGHRLEPSFLELCSMGSFSDAHECPEIPIIAANLHRLIPARQNQIWAVLHPTDSLQRLQYSLAATFLGRVCLSGAITDLENAQFELLKANLEFYERVKHLIRDGESRLYRQLNKSWRKPKGWQAVVRHSRDGTMEALAVIHAFGETNGCVIPVSLPESREWEITGHLAEGMKVHPGRVCHVLAEHDFSAAVIHFRARP